MEPFRIWERESGVSAALAGSVASAVDLAVGPVCSCGRPWGVCHDVGSPLQDPVRSDVALVLFAALGGGGDGFHEVRTVDPDGCAGRWWWPACNIGRTLHLAKTHVQLRYELRFSLAPRHVRGMGGVRKAHCLWSRVEGSKAMTRLERCGDWASSPPAPSLVILETPQRGTALWVLRRPLPGAWARQGNRRLAYHLGMPAGRDCDPEELFVPVPGSVLREGRVRPSPVVRASGVRCVDFTAREVVGRLKEAPSPDAWRARQEDL